MYEVSIRRDRLQLDYSSRESIIHVRSNDEFEMLCRDLQCGSHVHPRGTDKQ